ncbi:MAG: DUF4198 domain-containing protein [Limnobacter sp.]|nr:DUF4198 domain-containing protein [Limnobacter sp.]
MFKKIVYSSPVEGQLLYQGKPMPGVEVVQTLYSGGFKDDKLVRTTRTDATGKFHFDAVEERRLFRPDLLSANPMILQSIYADHDNQKYGLWSFQKNDFYERSETPEKCIKLNCNMSDYTEWAGLRFPKCQPEYDSQKVAE